MNCETITVTPASPHVGAEIGHIDLTRALEERQVREVREAITAHGVLFFRDQKIDFESHERLVRYFGEPHEHIGGDYTASKRIPGHPGIRKQYFDAEFKARCGRRLAFGSELRRNPADVQLPLSRAGSAKRRRGYDVFIRLQGVRRTQ